MNATATAAAAVTNHLSWSRSSPVELRYRTASDRKEATKSTGMISAKAALAPATNPVTGTGGAKGVVDAEAV